MSEVSVRRIKKRMLEAAFLSGEGHLPSSFSVTEIVYTILALLPKAHPGVWEFGVRDTFILSKGHSSLALYGVLEAIGEISSNWVNELGSYGGAFGGHPDVTKVPWARASTGSLGHGLPIAVGIALANRALGYNGKIVCLVGDGELNEGSNWEALMLADHHSLNNLYVVVDFNHSTDTALSLGEIERKIEAFGCEVSTADGHSLTEILDFFSPDLVSHASPKVLIANTVKGKGIPEFELEPSKWHHRVLSELEFDRLSQDLA